MAELLPEDLRDRARSLSDIGNCYLAFDDGTSRGDYDDVRYIPDAWHTWDNLTEDELKRVWLSPNRFEPNSAVGKSNTEYFLNKYGDRPGVVQARFMGVAIRIADLTEDMMEDLAGLHNYPVLDDDRHQQAQDEGQREAWEDWLRREFLRAIEKNLQKLSDISEIEVDYCGVDEDELYLFFRDRLNQVGGEWIEESDGGWCISGYEEAAKTVTPEDCEKLGLILEITPWEDSPWLH